MPIFASPTKLRDGSWGARVPGPVAVGTVVTIRTQGGKSWDARIASVVSTGDSGSVCTTESVRAKSTKNPKSSSKETDWKTVSLVGTKDDSTDTLHRREPGGGRGYKPDLTCEVGRVWRAGKHTKFPGLAVICLGAEAHYTTGDWEEDAGMPGTPSGWSIYLYVREAAPEESENLILREAEKAEKDTAVMAEKDAKTQVWTDALKLIQEGRVSSNSVYQIPSDQTQVAEHPENRTGKGINTTLCTGHLFGEPVYLIHTYMSDDSRTIIWCSQEVLDQLMAAEVARREITPEQAEEWLGTYKGCVGTDLYEWVLGIKLD